MTGIEVKEDSAAKQWDAKVGNWLRWALAFSPAFVVFALILQFRLPLPYQDSWGFVEQYQHWCEGRYSWLQLFTPHNVHPSAPGKAVYFTVLHFARGDVALLPLVSWMLSLVIALGVLALSRPLWLGRPAHGAGLMFLANLCIFTAAQGKAWIWDFVFQNFIPGACLVIGLLALSADRIPWWRWLLALLSALVSAFAFGTGFAVGFLLWPAACMAFKSSGMKARVLQNAAWLIFCGLAGWIALNAFGPGERRELQMGALLERPLDSIHYVVAMCGHALGRGTGFELLPMCAAWGSLLLAAFLGCCWRLLSGPDPVLIRRAWPWIALCLWAIFNAASICLGRFRVNPETGLTDYYGTFMLFLPLGVLMLTVTAWTRPGGTESAVGWMKKMAPAAVAVFVIAQVLSWNDGIQRMELFHRRMASRQAALDFAKVLPVAPGVFYNLDFGAKVPALVSFLKEQDRLRGVVFAPDSLVSSFPRLTAVSRKEWNVSLHSDTDGGEELRGACGVPKDPTGTPALILITATALEHPEKIIALVSPELPDDFFERVARRRKFYDHYFGWRWPVDRTLLPKDGKVTLRAYAYDGVKRKIRLIPGEAHIDPRESSPSLAP